MKKKLFIITVLSLSTVMYFTVKQELERIPQKMKGYTPNEIVYFSDTTGVWEDNFDSVYVFNGCVHYTHKQ